MITIVLSWILVVGAVVVFVQVIENLDTLVQLDSLYLGKNKITQIQNVSSLTQLTILSLQVRMLWCRY